MWLIKKFAKFLAKFIMFLHSWTKDTEKHSKKSKSIYIEKKKNYNILSVHYFIWCDKEIYVFLPLGYVAYLNP